MALALSWFPQLANTQGNMVVNGGFDTDASGWLTNNIGRDGGFYSGKGDPGGYFLLDNVPSPSLYPTISQVINNLIPGGKYTISGSYAYSLGLGDALSTNASFGVAIDGAFLFEAVAQQGSSWQNFSFIYTATAPSVTLGLSSQINNTQVSYLVDNIAMYAIPEPSAWSLIFLGSGVLICVRRNRKGEKCNVGH